MKRPVSNSLIALCVKIAVSNPTMNAVPVTTYYNSTSKGCTSNKAVSSMILLKLWAEVKKGPESTKSID